MVKVLPKTAEKQAILGHFKDKITKMSLTMVKYYPEQQKTGYFRTAFLETMFDFIFNQKPFYFCLIVQ